MAEVICYKGKFGYGTFDKKGQLTYFEEKGNDFKIIQIESDIDSDEIWYRVEGLRLGEPNVFSIPKKEAVDRQAILKYCDSGLDVNQSNASLVIELFRQKEEEYINMAKPIELVHSVAGVKTCEDAGGREITVFAGNSNPVNGSRYSGHFDLSPQGSLKDWVDFVKQEMKRAVEIQFVIALAFASILLGILKGKVDVDNWIVHLRGDSSSGKTTMLCLAISVFGNPDEQCSNGLISSWNGTRNAILRRLMTANGMLFGMDEFSMLRDKDVSGLIYSIATGIEKDRLRRDATLQKRLKGTYIVLSTGEAGILNRCNGNNGLSMRVLELDGQQWTDSAEQSERIKKFVKKNYALAGEDFGYKLGLWLQENGDELLLERYEYWRKLYCEKCTIQARKERMSERYGLILLAAEFFNDFYEGGMEPERICDFLICNEAENVDDRDSYGDFYNSLVAALMANFQHFSTPDNSEGTVVGKKINSSEREQWGAIETVKETIKIGNDSFAHKRVYIFIPYFDHIVYKLGYEDPKAIRKWMKKKGYTHCEKDRDTIRATIQGVRTTCVCVYLPRENDPNASDWMKVDKEELPEEFQLTFES